MSNDNESKTLRGRREFLKLGAIGAAAAVPLVMTLTPRQARARGSWIGNRDPNDPYAGAVMEEPMYGSWEWRQQKLQRAQQQQALQARYGSLGNTK